MLNTAMQSKENTSSGPASERESGLLQNKPEKPATDESKKVLPKLAKRVSFYTDNKQQDSDIKSEVATSENSVNKKDVNGNKINKTALDGQVLLTLTNKDKSEIEKTESEVVVRKPNNFINKDNIFIVNNEKIIVQKRTITTKTNSTNQLKSDFVKASDGPGTQTSFLWRNQKLSSSSPAQVLTVSSDPQSRLSESQSKIAKLQQSLPTKLSDATVQSLKNKYSPSNFGYPKSFPKANDKNLNGNSKIPSLVPKSPVVKTAVDSEIKEAAKPEGLDKFETISSNNNNICVKIDKNSPTNSCKDFKKPEKRTFKTELYITPEIDIEKEPATNETNTKKASVSKNVKEEKVDSSVTVKASVTVTEKIVCVEDLPITETSEIVIIEDDSDTVTLSNESLNSQEPVSGKDTGATKNSETSSSNLTLTEGVSEEEGMEDGKKKTSKKRSNSFKRIFRFGSKDKKQNEEAKSSKIEPKKTDGLSDNIENETSVFNRNAPQRHTFSGQSHAKVNQEKDNKPNSFPKRATEEKYQGKNAGYPNKEGVESNRLNSSLPVSLKYQYSTNQNMKVHETEKIVLQRDLKLVQPSNQRPNTSLNIPTNSLRADEYVCMNNCETNDLTQPGFINSHAVNKYIDTTSSSSTCTLESDTQNNLYENALQRKFSQENEPYSTPGTRIPLPRSSSSCEKKSVNNEKFYERPKFTNSPEIFTTTPRRIQDPQLIKPKAIIPINTERSLPNPYRNIKVEQNEFRNLNENLYGNINKSSVEDNLQDIPRSPVYKESTYGRPVPAARRNIIPDATYGNMSKVNTDTYIDEDVYGTVYDSLSPVGAQLKITRTNIIRSQNRNVEKPKIRPRSISPQRYRNSNIGTVPATSGNKLSDYPLSPIRKEIEATKLKLSANREKLEPRLKSPIDDKMRESKPVKKLEIKIKNDEKDIATNKQNLKSEVDYQDNNINEELTKKGTPEKSVFPIGDSKKQESGQVPPKREVKLQRSPHVSPTRPKSLENSPKPNSLQNISDIDNPTLGLVRSPVTVRIDSPVSSLNSSYSMHSSPRSNKPTSTEDLKDLKNTEVYFWEQTSKLAEQKNSAEKIPTTSSPQMLTEVVVHQQPPVSPKKTDTPVTSTQSLNVSQTIPKSPQKQQNLKNLEAFYWHEIKKLKEKEEQEIYNQQQILGGNNNAGMSPAQHRSRSMSPAVSRVRDKRSFSLPRDMQPHRINNDMYGYARKSEIIPEGKVPQPPQYGVVKHTASPSNFIRGSPQRSTIGAVSTQQESEMIYENYFPGVELRHQAKIGGRTPIFKRGSLTTNNRESPPQSNKKVSFSSAKCDENQAWPTKNGYTQSPPTRRVEKRAGAAVDDDVFYSDNYQNILPSLENEKNFQQQKESPNKSPTARESRLPSKADTNVKSKAEQTSTAADENYHNANIKQESSKSSFLRRVRSASVEPLYISNKPSNYPAQERMYITKPNDPNYGRTQTKQITVSNKYCDMYGQIHDQSANPYGNIKKSGVIYGQLQQNPVPTSPLSLRNQCINKSDPSFVRSGRLTSSFSEVRQSGAPRRPLPPTPKEKVFLPGKVIPLFSESESGSEAGEVQRILGRREMSRSQPEEEWNSDSKSGRGGGVDQGSGGGRENDSGSEVRSGRSSRGNRREDPRRHTLSGDQHYPPMAGQQGGPLSRTMDLEAPIPRGYPPPSSAMLFDDDPGIMSEVETSSTGFRRGGKQRSSLPVVRTPSKTLERPLGLVFLQYRNETKRALLPNEITSIDTVKALFVRSFPKQLTMEYLDSPLVKIYIHDSSKDMFYELEDLRSHLRDIRDRSVLRLFESADISGGLPGPGTGIAGGVGHYEDQSYFSEPEFDSEYQHQHIHKSKTSAAKSTPPYYMSSTTLPRGGPLLRAYSPAIGPIPADRLKSLPPDRLHTDGYMSSPERGSRGQYEDPYYAQYAARSGSITPVIDEEASDTELLDDSYSLYGVKLPTGGPRAVPAPRTQFPAPAAVPYDATRLRVENMERQLANLTGLVQKALHQNPNASREFLQVPTGRENYRTDKSVSFEKSVSFSDEPPDMNSPKQHSPQHTERDRLKPAPPPKPASLSPAQYDNSRHIYRDLQLTPEMYNQLRGLQKKAKDLRTEVRNLRRLSQAQAHSVRESIRDTFIKIRAMLLASGEQVWQSGIDQEKLRLSREEDLYKQEMLRLEKDLTELEATVEELRGNVINRKTRVNMSDVENMALILSKSSKTVADLKLRFPGLQDAMKSLLSSEMEKVVREEKFLKEEPERLESALRRCKKLTGTLVTLKRLASVQEQRLPCTNNTNDGRLSPSITETPPITPPSAQHSKTSGVSPARSVVGQSSVGGDSTASDSSQRPENALDALLDELQTFSKPLPNTTTTTVTTQMPQNMSYSQQDPTPPTIAAKNTGAPMMGEIGRKGSMDSATLLPVQNLTVSTATGSLRRLHSYPSGSDTDNSPPIQPLQRIQPENKTSQKPPIPERNAELLQHLASGRRVPPPPPPRTSSKSPLASPTSPNLPPRSVANQNVLQHIQNVQNMAEKPPQSQFETATQNLGLGGTLRRNMPGRSSLKEKSQTLPRNIGSNLQVQPLTSEANLVSASNSSSCESVNSQEGAKKGSRKEELEQRHQELLRKQKALQEQYARLQQLQRGNNTLTVVPPTPDLLLKKTGSESNLLQKMGLQMSATQQMTGSLTHLASTVNNQTAIPSTGNESGNTTNNTTTNKVYETDIL